MAKVERREIVQRVIDGLRLDVGRELTPQEVEDKIRAVFVANEENIIDTIRSATRTTTGSTTIFTTPSDKDFFLTYATLSYHCNASADAIQYLVQIIIDGATQSILRLSKITLIALNDRLTINFNPAIQLDRNTAISLTQTFTVGLSSVSGAVGGYTKES